MRLSSGAIVLYIEISVGAAISPGFYCFSILNGVSNISFSAFFRYFVWCVQSCSRYLSSNMLPIRIHIPMLLFLFRYTSDIYTLRRSLGAAFDRRRSVGRAVGRSPPLGRPGGLGPHRRSPAAARSTLWPSTAFVDRPPPPPRPIARRRCRVTLVIHTRYLVPHMIPLCPPGIYTLV